MLEYNHNSVDYLINPINPRKIGDRIKVACAAKAVTPAQLQAVLGLAAPQAIYNWYNGRSVPSLDHMAMLCQYLGISIDLIVYGDGKIGVDEKG